MFHFESEFYKSLNIMMKNSEACHFQSLTAALVWIIKL